MLTGRKILNNYKPKAGFYYIVSELQIFEV